jgi:branched-chain amino acid transport system substrate-binding protein
MKKSLMSAVALAAMVAFSGSAWADILIGVGGPITGPNAAFGAQLQKGAEQAADQDRARRRRVRPEAGRFGRQ